MEKIVMSKFHGFIYGLLSSASFGLIPLFTIPLMHEGMHFESILFYRFLLATITLAIIMCAKRERFDIELRDVPWLLLFAAYYVSSAMFLFWSYNFMSSGIATTMHFMYPVLTTILMMLLFHERSNIWRLSAIALALCGVYMLSAAGAEMSVSGVGVFIVLLSSLAYALYLVTMGQVRVGRMQGLKLNFYIFMFGTLMLLAGVPLTTGIQPVPGAASAVNLVLLAVVPTVVSNLALVKSIKSIGSTLTSVLGAMEPVTAVCVGIYAFGEPFTATIAIGVLLIISAVTIIILKR
jgi:drug/metabolite transporter (DMT)-like permease